MAQLKELRTRREVSLEELAEAISVDAETIIQWEEGVKIPGAASAIRLASYLNLPLKELYVAILNTPPAKDSTSA